jgi:hypothetical protein
VVISANHSPSCSRRLFLWRRLELGSRLAAGHPQGLALTPARTDGATISKREQGVEDISMKCP